MVTVDPQIAAIKRPPKIEAPKNNKADHPRPDNDIRSLPETNRAACTSQKYTCTSLHAHVVGGTQGRYPGEGPRGGTQGRDPGEGREASVVGLENHSAPASTWAPGPART